MIHYPELLFILKYGSVSEKNMKYVSEVFCCWQICLSSPPSSVFAASFSNLCRACRFSWVVACVLYNGQMHIQLNMAEPSSVIFSPWKIKKCPWKVLEFWFDKAVRTQHLISEYQFARQLYCHITYFRSPFTNEREKLFLTFLKRM